LSRLEQCQLQPLRRRLAFELRSSVAGSVYWRRNSACACFNRARTSGGGDVPRQSSRERGAGSGSTVSQPYFWLSQGGAWEASTGGRLYIRPHRPHVRRFLQRLPLGLIALAVAHGPRISCEALRKGIEERANRGNHAAPRWEHSMNNTGPRTQRRQQSNQCTAR